MALDERIAFRPVRIAVLTVSDTRTLEDDRSGDRLVERLTSAGHALADRAIVRDDPEAIVGKLHAWIDDTDVDVILTTGGTGVTGRDITPEALARVGWSWGEHARFFVGYNFLYLSDAVRPGDQIDRVVNARQAPLNGGGLGSGPERPALAVRPGDVWFQGLMLGFEGQW